MYQTADIVKVIGLTLGQAVTAADFAAADQRITDTDLFAGVTYEFAFTGKPPQYDLTFNVIEYDQVYPMRFEDLGVPEAELRKYLRERIPLYIDRIPSYGFGGETLPGCHPGIRGPNQAGREGGGTFEP